MDVMEAMQKSNLDIGAETIEMNKVEYMVRGIGYIKSLSDIEETVVALKNGVPIKIKDLAFVNFGPAARRGGLDKEGLEAVGGGGLLPATEPTQFKQWKI
ncbi:cation transporter [Fibrobacteria bacterium R8-3-H12]